MIASTNGVSWPRNIGGQNWTYCAVRRRDPFCVGINEAAFRRVEIRLFQLDLSCQATTRFSNRPLYASMRSLTLPSVSPLITFAPCWNARYEFGLCGLSASPITNYLNAKNTHPIERESNMPTLKIDARTRAICQARPSDESLFKGSIRGMT